MDSLKHYLHNFQKAHILCVGDLILDRYVYGNVSRISPEAPIPILNIEREFYTLGGVGNVAANIASLGASPHLIGLVGSDAQGEKLKACCEEKNISTEHWLTVPSFQTILKTRYCSHQQQLLRVDHEQPSFFGQDTYASIVEYAEKLMKHIHVLVLSDYGKGVLHPEYVIKPLLKLAQHHNVQTIVDPKSKKFEIYRGATIITPNKKELSEATHLPTATAEEVEKAAQWVIEHHGVKNVLATRSEQGMTLVRNHSSALHFPTQAKEVFDVSGAGDTVVATLAVGIAAGLPLEKAVEISNVAGGIVVGKIGTATVTPDDIIESYEATQHHIHEDKILSLPQAIERVRKWHTKGYKVGFTNGCFDLLHQGHVRLLHEAKNACQRLVIGLNSDSSVKTLKGESRPIKTQDERAFILASLQDVDMVVIFSEETPLKLIEALEPDVLIKGADYTVDKVVGAPFVIGRGGEVKLINLVEGFSTTGTLKKIEKTSLD